MTADPRLPRLATLAALLRDHHLMRLQQAVARKERAVLLREGLVAKGSDDAAAFQAQATYGRWAEASYRSLSAEIERHDAEVADRLATARLAFARARVLERLKDQLS